ncbi:hypothetical protein [Methylobacterium isbiliense]|uniref:Uncharacterized protein n=2 Tax=Methylobacterium isbiliense TaxID=315478 RepID=A0ABQ4S8I1_9HYPH|nr:hypothetical protein [Methylobacterium isbiliense]GJD98103.1 hypothetical protein GMJLKIPL_0009 [Methylobacterium isbiliense]
MQVLRIKDVSRPNGPFARSTINKAIAEGRLTARKVGGATVILADDWRRYVEGTPITSNRRQSA